ncbi:MAG TPA: AAA family ATPase [Lachnospiraceae bacterium]|nr:AAA family ATPase [Lachnospiraceae bacterium]HPF29194.1 AAA family ATPase [Lachnospiraceae bacterium]
MIYLSQFPFPDREQEYSFTMSQKRTCYDSFYPFQVISKHNLKQLDFEPITILYGGNGCGKTTVLNVIAETLRLPRDTRYNRSNFFEDYTAMCHYESEGVISKESRVITSDDVFDFMINLRMINDGINEKREELFADYMEAKYSRFRMQSLDDYEQLKRVNQARSKTQSKYVRENLMDNVREHSNGESASLYFSDKIKENALYLLDEPENSLSPMRQLELVTFLEESVRFFGCQFIMSTHSPFLLAMKGAKIYDMDEEPVDVKRWTDLSNVRVYHEFFQKHAGEFDL